MAAGIAQRAGLVLAGLVILALTFTLGMLVGRQRAQAPTQVVVAEPARKGTIPARRSGLAEAEAERPKGAPDRLTFYQTLTAPLGPAASPPKPAPAEKAKPDARRPAEPPPSRSDAWPPSRAGAAPEATAAATVTAVPPGPAGAAPAASPGDGAWTVQVGAFKSRPQAEAVQRGLVAAGLPVEVSASAAEDGHARYRVRVGSFRARAEAERMAERLRAERSLATYVTTR